MNTQNEIIDLPSEEWRDIVGYESSYQVSNLGRVKSFKRSSDKLLRPALCGKGYLFVVLSTKAFKVHRLVSIAFIPNTDNKPQVNHKNGIKTDNRVENLEWVTNKENLLHAYRTGIARVSPSRRGSNHWCAKLTEHEVIDIRASSLSALILSEQYKVSRETIYRIKDNLLWKSL